MLTEVASGLRNATEQLGKVHGMYNVTEMLGNNMRKHALFLTVELETSGPAR